MNWTDLSNLIASTGTPLTAVVGILVVVQGARLKRIEARLDALTGHTHPAPHCRPPRLSVISGPLLLLLCCIGCVQTRVTFRDASMTRTALLTHVSVPNIEVTTNGTFRASVDSDARTELLEVVLRLLAAP